MYRLKRSGQIYRIKHCHAPFPSSHFFFLQPNQSPQPQLPPRPTIQLGPHVQEKTQPAALPPVEINHILDRLSATPLHHPIMAIKWALISQPPIDARAWGQPATIATEAAQPRPPTALVRRTGGGRAQLPIRQDGAPGALIDSIMNGHNARDRARLRRAPLAPQRLVELALRGVNPVLALGRAPGRGRGMLMRRGVRREGIRIRRIGAWRGGGGSGAWDGTCFTVVGERAGFYEGGRWGRRR